MLPLQQAREVRDSVLEYVKATFRFKEKDVDDAFKRFIEDKKDGLFKGPYVSLKTPFVSASAEEEAQVPLEIKPQFPPYRHQLQAFRQLSIQGGHDPEPTLLTTGTGSGKTECFLYPILDYCWRCNRLGRQVGVKVIVMYPMNALASDQAKRLAETIWNDPRLKGKVTAGLFVGEGRDEKDYPREMGPDHVIENRDAIIDSVPDIVLTNFKMLDYGLMRQRFMPLWRGNLGSEDKLLKYIVLDELHTYDGAQGTDVANLIRRLKLKLGLPSGWLCPVGTSATIGNGPDSKARLCAYATDVFGEPFAEANVIEEHRIPVEDYAAGTVAGLPEGSLIQGCVFSSSDTVETYLARLKKVWIHKNDADPLEVGRSLLSLQIVRDLLLVLKDGVLTVDAVRNRLEENADFRRLRQHFGEDVCEVVIENLLALIAFAKRDIGGGKRAPLLYLQVQLWQRELSGILRYVQRTPEFVWRGSLKSDGRRVALPMWFCRECGASGWISRRLATDTKYESDVRVVTNAYFEKDRDLLLLNIESAHHKPVDDYLGENAFTESRYVHIGDLSEAMPDEDGIVRLRACRRTTETTNGRQKFARMCPECCARESMGFVGGRTSTLSSVAVSQVLASDFDAEDVRKRKLLLFNNSVQDAAHRAGFYEARTFRFLFRQSLQKYINTLTEPVNLVELQQGFRAYWHAQLEDEEYYFRFLPSDLAARIDLHRNYRDGAGFLPSFKNEFELRVDWEILSEFSLTAQLGRTLEKTGASASFFRRDDVVKVFDRMSDWMMANRMESVAENEEAFLSFVHGIVQRMRLHGAVDHPYLAKYRRESLAVWALNWNRDPRHFLNKRLGGSMQFPKLVGVVRDARNSEMLDVVTARTDRRDTWYTNYFRNTFKDSSVIGNVSLFNDFMRQLLDVMVETGLLTREDQGGGNYAIDPSRIWISRKVRHIQCENCQSRLCVAAVDTLSEGTHCLDYKCNGVYSNEIRPELDYYQQIYNRKIAPRVHAHDHTGLLERKDREELERDFKEHPSSDSVNVLAATSTLEMGIDIGDLNVVGNSDVPPTAGNFLQRIGRAGRKEGAALVLNYAGANEPHDMYYFTYPEEMMEGEVSTPGCYLEAKEILRRHFLASCIDAWTSAAPDNQIPGQIRDLHLMTEGVLTSDAFVFNRIIDYVKSHRRMLCSAFRSQYGEAVRPAVDKVFQSLDDESFYQRVFQVFAALADRLHALGDELNNLKDQKARIQPNDPALRQIDDVIRAVKHQYGKIVESNVLEFATNAGLLPNYAFPETGIKLEASIYGSRAKEDSDGNRAATKTLELVRPAAQGIRELAPGNSFYTQHRKLKITGVSTFDWKDALAEMRYCSKCDALALTGEDGFEASECPKCGDPSWGVNKHSALKFTGSRSQVKSEEAALDDSSDDRKSEHFLVKRHYAFRHQGAVTSYALRDTGFGIEFCNQLDLYEVNYGMQMQSGARTEVNNDSAVPELGFVTCRHCGKSVAVVSGASRDEDFHYPFCPHRTTTLDDDTSGSVFRKLYLYRHLRTEAIKVLLPVQIFESAELVEMFRAGIERGLKDYYQSSPDHIHIDAYDEVNRATGKVDHYLVLYDVIPGGTGYLGKLYNTEEFSSLLRKSYERIRDCSCQLEGKDGCYRCILSYGNQFRRARFSRETAEIKFKDLMDNIFDWEAVPGSIGTVSLSGVAEDSALELKFVEVLKTVARDTGGRFEKVPDVDGYRYELVLADREADTELKYYVVPQFRLGGQYGVRHYTVADFEIICMSARIEGRTLDRLDELPMWSVFLDGYAYHAQKPNLRFYGDKAKRDGIRDSKSHLMYFWTLTWRDINLFEGDLEDSLGLNSVSRLVEFLKAPTRDRILSAALGCIVDAENFLGNGGALYSGTVMPDLSAYESMTGAEDASEVARVCDGCLKYELVVSPVEEAIDQESWVGFWQRYNLLQFFSNRGMPAVEHVAEERSVDRDEVKAYYPDLESVVDQLLDHHIEFSLEGDVDLTDADGVVIAEAGLILRTQKVAIDPIDENSKAVFEAAGYRIVRSEEFDIDEVKGL